MKNFIKHFLAYRSLKKELKEKRGILGFLSQTGDLVFKEDQNVTLDDTIAELVKLRKIYQNAAILYGQVRMAKHEQICCDLKNTINLILKELERAKVC